MSRKVDGHVGHYVKETGYAFGKPPVSEAHTPTRLVILSGSLELSTGSSVPVRVILHCPRLTRDEERELENVRLVLHDLMPQVLSEIDACAACAEQTIAARLTDDAMRTEHTCVLPQEAR